MADEIRHLCRRLEQEGEKVCAFFESLPAKAWDQRVYTTGSQWQVRHLAAHFVTAERGYLHYLREAVAGGPGVPRDFDIDAFNESQVPMLQALTGPGLIDALRSVRRETVAFLAALKPTDLDLEGYHPWFGEGTLGFMVKLIYRHPMLHLRDVRQAIETGAPLPHGEGYSSFARDAAPEGGPE